MGKTEREISFAVLNDIYNKDAFSNIALEKYLKLENDKRKQNFVRELVYGVLENNIFIEHIISKSSKVKMKKIHKNILIILKMGIYQIIFMDSVPDSAAVNESVILAKKHGNKGSIGYVNGILRNISRNKEKFTEVNVEDPSNRISIKYSHPKWLVDEWIREYGFEFTEDLLKSNNKKPELNIRINTLKTNKEKLINNLEKKGFIIKEGKYSEDALIIENPFKISQTQEFINGEFTIQDESSTLVAQIMDPRPGSVVIDVCSAPGGKATHIAQKMNNKGKIISRDIYDHKIKLIEDNSSRLGIDIIETGVFDALKLDKSLINSVDYVLVDAPCSGLGLIRRKPEIKRNKVKDDIDTLSNLQSRILNNAKEYLKVGGILLYSTCTLGKKENLEVIEAFLEKNPNFKTVNIEKYIKDNKKFNTLDKGYIQLYPNIHETDGFFIAKMMKER